jgi:hypothetical protein
VSPPTVIGDPEGQIAAVWSGDVLR